METILFYKKAYSEFLLLYMKNQVMFQ